MTRGFAGPSVDCFASSGPGFAGDGLTSSSRVILGSGESTPGARSVTDLSIVRWIRELDENAAVGLARALIFAEAGSRGLPLDEFSMSGRVKARDQGIDGRTAFPESSEILLPRGR